MSLMDAMNELKKNNFDPNSGKGFNPYEKIPDGEYLMTFDGATHNAKGDRDFLMLSFTVVQGDYEGRKESLFPSLAQIMANGKPMPDSVIAKNIATIQTIGAMLNNPIENKCFDFENETDAYDALAEAFQPARGKLLKMTISTAPNKKNPKFPYRNYEFEKAEQPKVADAKDPFANTGEAVEVDDSDLPF